MNVLTGTTSAGMGSTVIMLVLMIAIFYFMLIRPENKRKKEAEQMRGAVKKGDKIVTIGGIVGVVVDVKESRIVVETSADQVRIELEKWAISSNETATEAAKAEAQEGTGSQGKGQGCKESRQGEEGLIAGRSKVFEKLKIRPMPLASGGFYMPNSTKTAHGAYRYNPFT